MIKNNNQASTFVFLGPSGSGKGTQALLIKEKFGFEFVEMGGIIRAEAQKNTDLGRQIKQIAMAEGKLLPDHISFALLQNVVLAVPTKKNLIIDGYPRTLRQVEDLDSLLRKAGRKKLVVFNIAISDEEVLQRLAKRLICADCKNVFVTDSKTEEGSLCTKCNGKLVRRADDTPVKIKERLRWGHAKVDPAIAEYRRRKILVDIDGSRSIAEVDQELVGYIEKYLQK